MRLFSTQLKRQALNSRKTIIIPLLHAFEFRFIGLGRATVEVLHCLVAVPESSAQYGPVIQRSSVVTRNIVPNLIPTQPIRAFVCGTEADNFKGMVKLRFQPKILHSISHSRYLKVKQWTIHACVSALSQTNTMKVLFEKKEKPFFQCWLYFQSWKTKQKKTKNREQYNVLENTQLNVILTFLSESKLSHL